MFSSKSSTAGDTPVGQLASPTARTWVSPLTTGVPVTPHVNDFSQTMAPVSGFNSYAAPLTAAPKVFVWAATNNLRAEKSQTADVMQKPVPLNSDPATWVDHTGPAARLVCR